MGKRAGWRNQSVSLDNERLALTSLATQLAPADGLAVRPSNLDGTLQPRTQQQQVFEAECVAAFAESPQLLIRYVENGAEARIALRFPRFLHVRDDKSPEDATSAQQIADMYNNQDVVKNSKGGAAAADDDDDW